MDCQAKWDVFAECFIRLSAEERCRFVDYGKVEVELVREMAEDEGDTLDGGASSENKRAAVPKILLDEQVQIMCVGTYTGKPPIEPIDSTTTVAPSLLTHGSSVLRSILVSHRDPELQDDDTRGGACAG